HRAGLRLGVAAQHRPGDAARASERRRSRRPVWLAGVPGTARAGPGGGAPAQAARHDRPAHVGLPRAARIPPPPGHAREHVARAAQDAQGDRGEPVSRALAALAATALLVAVTASTAAASAPPPIHHVFVIVLENEGASQTFGANPPAPYLAQTLVANGAFVPKYYGTGHESRDNYIAMISGQAPNADTQGDCQFYQDPQPGTVGAGGQ